MWQWSSSNETKDFREKGVNGNEAIRSTNCVCHGTWADYRRRSVSEHVMTTWPRLHHALTCDLNFRLFSGRTSFRAITTVTIELQEKPEEISEQAENRQSCEDTQKHEILYFRFLSLLLPSKFGESTFHYHENRPIREQVHLDWQVT